MMPHLSLKFAKFYDARTEWEAMGGLEIVSANGGTGDQARYGHHDRGDIFMCSTRKLKSWEKISSIHRTESNKDYTST
ncbi:hypothetical protein L2E82_50201 [Cichorium intybus]|nr:hypothetical protein L2E82_50201 [Cichorium intybus]